MISLILDKWKESTSFTKKLLIASFVVLAISILAWLLNFPGKKYVFRFESVDSNKICFESRYLPQKNFDESVSMYIEELLLGPKTERLRPVFSPGTKSTYSFVKGKVLYVNITAESLYSLGNASQIFEGTELLKKNVLKTFSKIKDVELFIDNKSIYKY